MLTLIKNSVLLLILAGCGFTSSSYNEIITAEDQIKNNNFEKAVKTYEKVLFNKPNKAIQIKIHFQLGEIHSIYLGNYRKAIAHFNEILKLTNDPLWQIKSFEKIANINFQNLKNFNKCIKIYSNLLSFKPKLKSYNFYLFRKAISQLNTKNYSESQNNFIKLTKLDYDNQVYYYLGLNSFYQAKWEAAINYWFSFIKNEKRKDQIVLAKFLIGNAYESSEKLKEAYSMYYSILGEYPNSEVINQRLESLYKRRVSRKR